MEFLRFGSSIPGAYWGCCAVDIIQNFKFHPDNKASIQLVSGDGGGGLTKDGQFLFAGPTYRDIFHQRLRYGTFSNRDMPSHGFLAILTQDQISGSIGGQWLQILREAGFEFIRSVSNSVYTGNTVGKPAAPGSCLNHVFALFRNIGAGAPLNPFTPPKAWTDLPKVKTEFWEVFSSAEANALAEGQASVDKAIWDRIGPAKFMTEEELSKAGVPVVMAGIRSDYPQQTKAAREAAQAVKAAKGTKTSAFPPSLPLSEPTESEEPEDENEVCDDPDCTLCN